MSKKKLCRLWQRKMVESGEEREEKWLFFYGCD